MARGSRQVNKWAASPGQQGDIRRFFKSPAAAPKAPAKSAGAAITPTNAARSTSNVAASATNAGSPAWDKPAVAAPGKTVGRARGLSDAPAGTAAPKQAEATSAASAQEKENCSAMSEYALVPTAKTVRHAAAAARGGSNPAAPVPLPAVAVLGRDSIRDAQNPDKLRLGVPQHEDGVSRQQARLEALPSGGVQVKVGAAAPNPVRITPAVPPGGEERRVLVLKSMAEHMSLGDRLALDGFRAQPLYEYTLCLASDLIPTPRGGVPRGGHQAPSREAGAGSADNAGGALASAAAAAAAAAAPRADGPGAARAAGAPPPAPSPPPQRQQGDAGAGARRGGAEGHPAAGPSPGTDDPKRPRAAAAPRTPMTADRDHPPNKAPRLTVGPSPALRLAAAAAATAVLSPSQAPRAGTGGNRPKTKLGSPCRPLDLAGKSGRTSLVDCTGSDGDGCPAKPLDLSKSPTNSSDDNEVEALGVGPAGGKQGSSSGAPAGSVGAGGGGTPGEPQTQETPSESPSRPAPSTAAGQGQGKAFVPPPAPPAPSTPNLPWRGNRSSPSPLAVGPPRDGGAAGTRRGTRSTPSPAAARRRRDEGERAASTASSGTGAGGSDGAGGTAEPSNIKSPPSTPTLTRRRNRSSPSPLAPTPPGDGREPAARTRRGTRSTPSPTATPPGDGGEPAARTRRGTRSTPSPTAVALPRDEGKPAASTTGSTAGAGSSEGAGGAAEAAKTKAAAGAVVGGGSSSSSPSSSSTPPRACSAAESKYSTGDLVDLIPQFGPGNNNPGGVARVRKVSGDGTYVIRLVLGNSRQQTVEEELLRPYHLDSDNVDEDSGSSGSGGGDTARGKPPRRLSRASCSGSSHSASSRPNGSQDLPAHLALTPPRAAPSPAQRARRSSRLAAAPKQRYLLGRRPVPEGPAWAKLGERVRVKFDDLWYLGTVVGAGPGCRVKVWFDDEEEVEEEDIDIGDDADLCPDTHVEDPNEASMGSMLTLSRAQALVKTAVHKLVGMHYFERNSEHWSDGLHKVVINALSEERDADGVPEKADLHLIDVTGADPNVFPRTSKFGVVLKRIGLWDAILQARRRRKEEVVEEEEEEEHSKRKLFLDGEEEESKPKPAHGRARSAPAAKAGVKRAAQAPVARGAKVPRPNGPRGSQSPSPPAASGPGGGGGAQARGTAASPKGVGGAAKGKAVEKMPDWMEWKAAPAAAAEQESVEPPREGDRGVAAGAGSGGKAEASPAKVLSNLTPGGGEPEPASERLAARCNVCKKTFRRGHNQADISRHLAECRRIQARAVADSERELGGGLGVASGGGVPLVAGGGAAAAAAAAGPLAAPLAATRLSPLKTMPRVPCPAMVVNNLKGALSADDIATATAALPAVVVARRAALPESLAEEAMSRLVEARCPYRVEALRRFLRVAWAAAPRAWQPLNWVWFEDMLQAVATEASRDVLHSHTVAMELIADTLEAHPAATGGAGPGAGAADGTAMMPPLFLSTINPRDAIRKVVKWAARTWDKRAGAGGEAAGTGTGTATAPGADPVESRACMAMGRLAGLAARLLRAWAGAGEEFHLVSQEVSLMASSSAKMAFLMSLSSQPFMGQLCASLLANMSGGPAGESPAAGTQQSEEGRLRAFLRRHAAGGGGGGGGGAGALRGAALLLADM